MATTIYRRTKIDGTVVEKEYKYDAVTLWVNLTDDQAERFKARCKALDTRPGKIVGKLIKDWLKQPV